MRTYWRIVIGTLWGVLMCALLHVLLSGCASHRVTVGGSTQKTDTVYRMNMVRDTMLVKDSVLVSIFSAGDTVYKTREVWRWRDRTNVRVDTVYKNALRVDTVRVPVAVERKLSWWERTVERPLQQVVGAFIDLGTIIFVLYVAVRLLQRRDKDTEIDE
jgi:hypothetical protein|nr:MAG TPA: type VI secretion protein [Caudoviricetes sp.]